MIRLESSDEFPYECHRWSTNIGASQLIAMHDLMGHEHILGLLKRTAVEGRPAHSYLFTGMEGIGKKLVATRFACLLNCPDPMVDPMGTCPVCRRIAEGNHPDVIFERPERGLIRINRIRDLQNYFRYAPVEGNWRVIIVDDAHQMNIPAQNALLKTLEEPPPGRLLILVTSKPYMLLSTVRSRCRRIRFGPLAFDVLADFLRAREGLAKEAASVLSAQAGGSVSRAMEMNDAAFASLREKVMSALSAPGSNGLMGILELSSLISTDREQAVLALQIAYTWIRDVLCEKTCSDPDAQLNSDWKDKISLAARRYSYRQLFSVFEECVNAGRLIESEMNINRNLVTDVMLLRIARIMGGADFGVGRSAA